MSSAIKTALPKLVLFGGSLALFFGIAEATVRAVGHFDQAGNFVFKNRIIHPHRIPIDTVGAAVQALEDSDRSIVVYHRLLGWVPRPLSSSANGLYHYNSQGLRSAPREYVDRPDSGVLRIALFGDSFTHGNDVPLQHTFGALLEEKLYASGMPAEVMNFGVGGYGIDQAFLRFRAQGASNGAQVVVLGFQPENLKRNLNLLRVLYDPRTNLPFAKPRFVLAEGGIRLINVPVLPLDRIVPTLRDLDNWDLLPHEYFYDRRDYQGAWWQKSKLLATVAEFRTHSDDEWLLKRILYRENSEEQQLGWAVIQAFAQEVAATGATFLIVHLPTKQEMGLSLRLGRWPYQTFLDALDQEYAVVHPEQAMGALVRESGIDELFAGHYTRAGNEIVADAIFTQLTRQQAD